VKWRVDGWDLGQFSDDGKYVIAQNLDGSESYAIFDAITGHKVASLDTIGDNVGIGGPVWDFNDTLLAVASDGHNEAIVRFDLNGHPTRATEVRPVSGVNDVYRLATRP
jgi:hypothetical protein